MNDSESAASRADAGIGPRARRVKHLWWLAVAVIALAGAALVLVSTAKYGAGVESWDSVWYLDVARNLAAGRGFVYHTGEPLVWWPPLYPALLAFFGFATGLDPEALAHLVNALLSAWVVCLSARLFRAGFRQSATYCFLGVCAVLLSKPLSAVYAAARSEVLFIPLVLLYLIFAQRYWNNGGVLALAVMALATALACLTRYVGVALVLAGVVTIILAKAGSYGARLTRAFSFGTFSLAPLGLWAVRDYRLTGTLFGDRGPQFKFTADSIILYARTAGSWYLPGNEMRYVLLVVIAAGLVAAVSSRAARRRALSSLNAVLSYHSPAVLLLAAYFIALLVAVTTGAVIDTRMLSPVYIPTTLVLLQLAYGLLSPLRPVPKANAGRVPVILLALWLCFALANVARATAGRLKNGAGGYSVRAWRESPTVAYARQVLRANDDVRVYSNGPDALWGLARVNATATPDRMAGSLADLEGRWPADKGSVVVWFRNITWRPYLFSFEELKEIARTAEVARFSDGSIYRVSARETLAHEPSRQVGGPNGQAPPRHRFP